MSGVEDAIASEAEIAERAAGIRGDAELLSADLFRKLYPLLLEPIPEGFIVEVPPVQGKPYASTGIRSVQVQIDRMNAVLTPLWWRDEVEYFEGGKLAAVTVSVFDGAIGEITRVFAQRTSYGGVDRASSTGNLYKGSYTNAAKLAFARIGPGHEIYLGVADLDPDVSEEAAAESTPEPKAAGEIGEELAEKLWIRANELGLKERLQLAASHVADRNVGDAKTKAKAKKALASLTFAQSERLDAWLSRKADEAAAKDEKAGGE